MEALIFPVLLVAVVSILAGLILAFAAKFFAVEVDERVTQIRECLPGANCGGCGFAGCDDYAASLVANPELATNLCTVGGPAVAQKISEILGVSFEAATPKHALVHCNGTCQNTKYAIDYEGPQTCAACNTLFGGRGTCNYGCIGFGDCVAACNYDAIHLIDGVAVVDPENCVACGACVRECPKHILELRLKGPKEGRRVYVACANQDKGGVAKKACKVACIGCGKCAKACPFGAITVENNLAYIDFNKCKLCRKCVAECPTGAIHAVNFPVKPPVAPEAGQPSAVAVPANEDRPAQSLN